MTSSSEMLKCGEGKIGYRMESRIGSQINEIQPVVCFPGYCGRAGHAVITQYVLMMVLAAAAVFI